MKSVGTSQTCLASAHAINLRKRPHAFRSNYSPGRDHLQCKPMSAVIPPEKDEDGGTGKARLLIFTSEAAPMLHARGFEA